MELSSEFEVRVPVDHAWALVTDLELLAGRVPEARLQGWDGTRVDGRLEVPLGPLTARYVGSARIVDRDEGARHVLLTATAREMDGGGAVATVSVRVKEIDDDRTHVSLLADIEVTGTVAQFGRVLLHEAHDHLVTALADRVERAWHREDEPEPSAVAAVPVPAAVQLSDLVFTDLPAPAPGRRRGRRTVATGIVLAVLVAGGAVGAVGARSRRRR